MDRDEILKTNKMYWDSKAGFVIEQMVEQSDKETMEAVGDVSDKTKKAKMLPISFCIKARKQ